MCDLPRIKIAPFPRMCYHIHTCARLFVYMRAGVCARVSLRACMLVERERPRGRPARSWRDELDDYWNGTIWQRIAQDRQMWKQHAEAFAQLWDTMAA